MWWQEVIEDVTFYDNKGNVKVEEISGRDLNQFESLCDLYAELLVKRWGTNVRWKRPEKEL